MDELDTKKRILLKNKDYILRMPNNKKKVEMLRSYFSLLDYCKIINNEDEVDEELDIDDEFTGKYDQYVFGDTTKIINEFEINALKLYEKYTQIIETYKENDFCNYEYIGLIKVNADKMIKALWDFFAFLGDDVLEIYHKMIMGQNIFLNSYLMDRLGYALDSTSIDNACITVQNIPNYLDFYLTLAHEIGHCYQFNLQKHQKIFSAFDPYCEITSILFEKLFLEYLIDNHIIKNHSSLNLESHIGFLNNVSISKIICKLFMDKKIGLINPYNLSYTCGVSEEDIEKEIIEDCGYVPPVNLKPELTEIHYSIGNIVAMHFMEKLKEDFDIEWKNFKNFICTVQYLPMGEVIDEYFDIDLVKRSIKKLTKSYRGR